MSVWVENGFVIWLNAYELVPLYWFYFESGSKKDCLHSDDFIDFEWLFLSVSDGDSEEESVFFLNFKDSESNEIINFKSSVALNISKSLNKLLSLDNFLGDVLSSIISYVNVLSFIIILYLIFNTDSEKWIRYGERTPIKLWNSVLSLNICRKKSEYAVYTNC